MLRDKVTMRELQICLMICKAPITTQEIEAAFVINNKSVQTLISRMYKKNLIYNKNNHERFQPAIYCLTPKGHDLIGEIKQYL